MSAASPGIGPCPIAWAACAVRDGRLLLGLAKGLYLADPDHARRNPVAGATGRRGSANARNPHQRRPQRPQWQFRLRHQERTRDMRPSALLPVLLRPRPAPAGAARRAIPNSICFGADGRTHVLLRFARTGDPVLRLRRRTRRRYRIRAIRRIDAADASPDGSIIDAEGYLWNAQWGAGRIVRYRTDGSVGRIVPLPAKNPSCCTLGGAAFDRLYVSSARGHERRRIGAHAARGWHLLPASGATCAACRKAERSTAP